MREWFWRLCGWRRRGPALRGSTWSQLARLVAIPWDRRTNDWRQGP